MEFLRRKDEHMDAWIDAMAEALGEERLTESEATTLLRAARDVAHRVERRTTPLAAFLIGSATARAVAAGATRETAIGETLRTVETLLPDRTPED
ncbi:MAG TPA: DUF6457 domain-containing protein [Actinomycetota bacterium]